MKKTIIAVIMAALSVTSFGKGTQGYNVTPEALKTSATKVAYTVFSSNQEHWKNLLLGTLASETGMGTYKGSSKHGITQVTPIAFKEIKRVLKPEDRVAIRENLGFDLMNIPFTALEHNHTASIVCAALLYKITVKTAPKNIYEYANTWKRVYNTHLGAGSSEGFVKHYKKFVLGEGAVTSEQSIAMPQSISSYKYIKKDIPILSNMSLMSQVGHDVLATMPVENGLTVRSLVELNKNACPGFHGIVFLNKDNNVRGRMIHITSSFMKRSRKPFTITKTYKLVKGVWKEEVPEVVLL